jgi:hypothetical protein
MGKLTIVIDDEYEERLRDRVRRKGDLSRLINEALGFWFSQTEASK